MKLVPAFLLTILLLLGTKAAFAAPVYFCGTTDRARSYGVNDPNLSVAKRKALQLCRRSSRTPADCGKVSQCRGYNGRVARFSSSAAFPAAPRPAVAAKKRAPAPAAPTNGVASRSPRPTSGGGDMTRYNDGSYAVKNGDMTRYSDGSYSVKNGDMTRYSDGSYSVTNGDMTRYSDGSYSVKTGNVTRYSDGRTCTDNGGYVRCD